MALLAIGAVGGAISLAASSSSSSSTPAHFSRLSFSRTQSVSADESSLSLAATSLSVASLQDALPSSSLGVYCGRGDKKTAKGKRFRHSFGNCRPRNKKRGRGPPRAPMPPSPPKKDKFDDGEIVKIDIDESLFS
ncbi:30S ribosomal protein S31, chloroplastic isoform X2 [Asparagus officinalis]|uniref:30S ribosomal protein S31, chloroplastic isoform X2 n=1 Tax=Asparagus officinalis TaxID=4686 RepID=UPI00098E5DBB|nr:30S ribosomal protein S31, chloroplastic isoform X2 [Asparagus officinalis]